MTRSKHLVELSFGTLHFEAAQDHPNKMKFSGVLVRLDEASTKAPNGSEGHRIFLPTKVAEKKLKTLINTGLNYSEDLDKHAQRRKVGTIIKAWIQGKDLCVEGVIWKKDFPEAQTDLKRKDLGMSMELGEVSVVDCDADIWVLDDFTFLGATILKKDAAAYYRTQAIAARAEEGRKGNMAIKSAKTATVIGKVGKVALGGGQIAKIAAQAATAAVEASVTPTLNAMTTVLTSLSARMDDLEATSDVDSAMDEEMETKEADACDGEIKSAKKKATGSDDEDDDDDDAGDEEDGDEMDSAVDKGDLEDLGEADDGDEDDPGHMNKDAKNKGDKTTSEDKVGKTVSSGALKQIFSTLTKLNEKIDASVALSQKLAKQAKRQRVQLNAASKQTERRSLTPELITLLAKGGVDGRELQASGTKMSVSDVDGIMATLEAAGVRMDTVQRMTIKHKFLQAGVMEQGVVHRGLGL
jgi:hypothetical protein